MKKRDALDDMLPLQPAPVPPWLALAAGIAFGALVSVVARWLLS